MWGCECTTKIGGCGRRFRLSEKRGDGARCSSKQRRRSQSLTNVPDGPGSPDLLDPAQRDSSLRTPASYPQRAFHLRYHDALSGANLTTPTSMNIRAFARNTRDGTKRFMQRVELRSALSRLEQDLRSGTRPKMTLLHRLARGWGNQWWSASPNLVTAVLDWLPKTTGPILECGSGLTTLVLAVAAAQSGRPVISLEHDQEWADRVLAALPDHLCAHVTLRLTPIKEFGEFDWYSVSPDDLPPRIGLVLCDGPPGGTRGGRYGLAPVVAKRLAARCVVLLDDTQRPGEHTVLERWRSEFHASVLEEGGTYSVIEIRAEA